tara:strand:- start:16291 stop:17304 length:1014 start_codon:yes stop_codon:yes gene_type:complete
MQPKNHREIIIAKYGDADAMRMQALTPKAPKPGEVRIDVRYSGINFADIQMRLGFYPDAPKKPFVPGYEVSGVVAAVGAGVTRFREGDEVVAGTVFGGYSSSINLAERNVFPMPKGSDLAAGAAMPVNFFTAHVALFEMARIRKGDQIMIDCATGGVGTLAIQMAVRAGASVVGLTGTASKKSYIEDLGGVAMTRDEFYSDASVKDFDFILNASGGAEIDKQRARLRITGRMVCLGMNSGVRDGKRNILRMLKAVVQTPRISVVKLFGANTGIFGLNALHVLQDDHWIAKLGEAFAQLDEHPLVPHVGQTFAAEKVADAHEFLQTRKAVGKILLEWS